MCVHVSKSPQFSFATGQLAGGTAIYVNATFRAGALDFVFHASLRVDGDMSLLTIKIYGTIRMLSILNSSLFRDPSANAEPAA